jgi:hypothetical protein
VLILILRWCFASLAGDLSHATAQGRQAGGLCFRLVRRALDDVARLPCRPVQKETRGVIGQVGGEGFVFQDALNGVLCG